MDNETRRKILEGALKLLGPNGERWIKDEYQSGNNWCLLGAIGASALQLGVVGTTTDEEENNLYEIGDRTLSEFGELSDLLGDQISVTELAQNKGFDNVPEFNDDAETEWEDIQQFVQERLNQLQAAL